MTKYDANEANKMMRHGSVPQSEKTLSKMSYSYHYLSEVVKPEKKNKMFKKAFTK